MHKNLGKWICSLWLVCLISLTAFPMEAIADVPYRTFTKNSYGRNISTQPAYSPAGVLAQEIPIVGDKGETQYTTLQRPQDLFIAPDDDIYIADTDNNRIVHLNEQGELVKIITVPKSPLKQPQGVFVAENGDIYIADTGNKRVVQLNSHGEWIREIGRPESRYVNEAFVYEPTNMVVDKRGFIYVVSKGSYNGIVQFNPEGKFDKFFGTNKTEVTAMDIIRRQFYTKEQLSRQVRLLPVTIRNIDIDERGFIYTVSGSKTEQIKKMNIRGENVWKDIEFNKNMRSFSDLDKKDDIPVAEITDASVDSNGNVAIIDKSRNIISQYDSNGSLLFYWNGRSVVGKSLVGLTTAPVAVETNSKNRLYILDEALGLIQVYEPTEFGAAVHEAYRLMQEGKYSEAEKHWENVLKLNAHFSPAYEGLAQAAFFRGEYERSRELFKLAGDGEGYSDSFWQLRLQWFQANFSTLANSVIITVILIWFFTFLKKKFKFRVIPKMSRLKRKIWYQQAKHVFYILKHPLDGFTDLRFLSKGGYTSAIIILLLTIGTILVKSYYTSFTFNPVPVYAKGSTSTLTIFLATWLSWVVCNYLIGSIRQGEARFKDVFVGSSYSLFPVILLGLPLAALSNIFTLSEMSIYGSIGTGMMLWCGLLFFWNIQALQNYGVGETVVNILLTVLTMIILWVVIFILIGLSSEFFSFVYTIYQEVSM
ncbi:PknD [Paenibacillus sp. KQZ6P-2]|uniref:PknD n=1 Tax=Paenibacillus mangrovi TaxID=2931978 RepID=A0A9X1WPF1_9BACL|nr:YIP1 family protein [Paenibacillus mangrovi]MCJ8012638.1 PknD [Paenibacillus mangrovi]